MPVLHDPRALIGIAVAAVVAVRFRASPALIVLGAGVLGVLGAL